MPANKYTIPTCSLMILICHDFTILPSLHIPIILSTEKNLLAGKKSLKNLLMK